MAYLIDSDVMVDFTRGNAKAADYLDSLTFRLIRGATRSINRGAMNLGFATQCRTIGRIGGLRSARNLRRPGRGYFGVRFASVETS